MPLTDLSQLDLFVGIQDLVAAAEPKGFDDPGPDGYDTAEEEKTRELMQQVAYYAESGPLYDPDGAYLCGACQMRKEEDDEDVGGCTHVSGRISMGAGSCQIWRRGQLIEIDLPTKLTQVESNYAERPKQKGFGCYPRCGWGQDAKGPDADGRSVWCRFWGVHVRAKACCMMESGKDSVVAPGE